jgi:ribosome maturation factor RimP
VGPCPLFVFLGLFLGTRTVSSIREADLDRLRAAATRVAASHGLELFDLQFRRESIGWVLRVIIDRPADADGSRREGPEDSRGSAGAVAREGPVGIADCQRVSHDLGTLLDVEDDLAAALDRAYTLEVSSPGLDRPLRGEADYRRFAGRLAKIVTRAPVDGQSHFAGRLSGVDGDVVLVADGRRVHRVPMDAISRARLDVEF